MKIMIIEWPFMTDYWLNRASLEGKELEVIREVESTIYKGKISYLIKEPNTYVPAKNCKIVVE